MARSNERGSHRRTLAIGQRTPGPAIRVLLALAAGWLSFGTTPGIAQEADTARAEPERPFVEGGQGDRPYLFDLAGRLAVGGYAEGHFRFVRLDGITEEQTFLAKRFNLVQRDR